MTIPQTQAPAHDYFFKAGALTEGEQLARRWVFDHFGDPIDPVPGFSAGTVSAQKDLGALGALAYAIESALFSASGLAGRIFSRRARTHRALPPPKPTFDSLRSA